MSQVRYFPRYSQKENIVTNNVLLLMNQLYNYNRMKFGRFLAALGDEASNVAEHLQLQFNQQRRMGAGVPDGFIAQDSMKIVIETKLQDSDFSFHQLERYLSAFGEEKHRLLVLLSPGPTGPDSDVLQEIRNKSPKGVATLQTTFDEILAAAKTCLSDHDEDMLAVLEDFAAFCNDLDLLPRDKFRMFTPPCGQSFDDNREYRLYYYPVYWNRRASQYLGIYKEKSVRLIGQIKKTVICNINIEQSKVETKDEIDDEERERILAAARSAHDKRGWDITNDHRFFLCDEVVETDFRKVSPYGIQGHRYFDLGEELKLKELPSTAELGKLLKDRTWQ